jgi:hypothetical protein
MSKCTRLKGLSYEMDLAFDDMHGHWSVIGLNWGRGQFLNFFRGSKDFMCIKSVFLAVNASLRWLNNVSGVY